MKNSLGTLEEFVAYTFLNKKDTTKIKTSPHSACPDTLNDIQFYWITGIYTGKKFLSMLKLLR